MADLAADPRLAPYLALAADRFLTVPDPRRAVLEDTPRLFLAIKIRLTEPARLSGSLKHRDRRQWHRVACRRTAAAG